MEFTSNLFFTDIDFCKGKVIKDLDLNFNLHSLILFRGASVFNKVSQSLEKWSRIKFSRSNFDQFFS